MKTRIGSPLWRFVHNNLATQADRINWNGVVHGFRSNYLTRGYCFGKSFLIEIFRASNENSTFQMYRLWVTDQKRMRSMWFPIFLWLSGVVCNAIELFLQVKSLHDPNYGPYKWASVNMKVGPGIAIIPFVASTILLNAYCTGKFVETTNSG